METQSLPQLIQQPSTSVSVPPAPTAWSAETIRAARKAKKLTQVDLAFALGCRQQTISEWELGLYAPKNAYQKLLNQFFATEGGGAKDGPSSFPSVVTAATAGSFTITVDQLHGAIAHMQTTGLDELRIDFRHAQDTFTIFGGPEKTQEAAGELLSS